MAMAKIPSPLLLRLGEMASGGGGGGGMSPPVTVSSSPWAWITIANTIAMAKIMVTMVCQKFFVGKWPRLGATSNNVPKCDKLIYFMVRHTRHTMYRILVGKTTTTTTQMMGLYSRPQPVIDIPFPSLLT